VSLYGPAKTAGRCVYFPVVPAEGAGCVGAAGAAGAGFGLAAGVGLAAGAVVPASGTGWPAPVESSGAPGCAGAGAVGVARSNAGSGVAGWLDSTPAGAEFAAGAGEPAFGLAAPLAVAGAALLAGGLP